MAATASSMYIFVKKDAIMDVIIKHVKTMPMLELLL